MQYPRTLASVVLLAALAGSSARADTNELHRITGSVLNSDGKPVADAVVECYQYDGQLAFSSEGPKLVLSTNTGTNGMASFNVPGGLTVIVARKSGFAPGWQQLIPAGTNTPASLLLTAPSAIAGVVVDDKDQPVADAEVWATGCSGGSALQNAPFLVGRAARTIFSARTGADGRFRINNLPDGAQLALDVAKPGKALRANAADLNAGNVVPYAAGDETVQLVMLPGAAASGVVRLRDSAQPLAGVKLQLQTTLNRLNGTDTREPAVSDADGKFKFTDVAPGSYQVIALPGAGAPPDWVVPPVTTVLAVSDNITNLRVEAVKGGLLQVTVVGAADGKPMPDINLGIYGTMNPQPAITGPDGKAQIRLAPGRYSVNANGQAGNARTPAQVSIVENTTNQVRMELAPPFKIRGLVRDAAGAPLPDVDISVIPPYFNNVQLKTDAEGRFEFAWSEQYFQQNYNFQILARSLARNLALAHALDARSTNLDLRLQPGFTLATRVQTADGKPLSNFTANLVVWSGDNGFWVPPGRQPDADGRFEINALPPGLRYGLNVGARGYGTADRQMDRAEPETNRHEFATCILRLADRQLAGQVLGPNGLPAAGVSVYLNGDGQPSGNARTDAKGHFEFKAVCEGTLQLSANYRGGYGNVQAAAGRTNVVLRITDNGGNMQSEPMQITGTVFDPAGAPAPGVLLKVMPLLGMNYGDVKSDSNGKYELTWQSRQMGNRSISYSLIARDLEHNFAAASNVDEKTTNQDIHLNPGFVLTGAVQDPKGKSITSASLQLILMNDTVSSMLDAQPARTDDKGAFEFRALPPGERFNLQATAPGYGSESRQIAQNQTATALKLPAFVLKLADKLLAGKVLDAAQNPVVGANVQLSGVGQPTATTRSDAQGHFSFTQVCDGAAQLYVFPANGGNTTILQTRGGDTNVVVRLNAANGRAVALPPPAPIQAVTAQWTGLMNWYAQKKKLLFMIYLQLAVLSLAGGGIFGMMRSRKQGSLAAPRQNSETM